jgi:hypothetical protein
MNTGESGLNILKYVGRDGLQPVSTGLEGLPRIYSGSVVKAAQEFGRTEVHLNSFR